MNTVFTAATPSDPIRLRGDRIVDTLKRISPRGYADLNF